MRDGVEIPGPVLVRIRTLCLSLPEVTVRTDESRRRERSRAYSFDIRRRSFCLLVAHRDLSGGVVVLTVVRARADERAALLAHGHPFHPSRAGADRVTVILGDDTDWAEIGELVTESYRMLAPKKLTARLDAYPPLALIIAMTALIWAPDFWA